MEKQSTRIAYGQAIAKLGETRSDILVCDADLAHATMTIEFKKKFPDRFYNFGVAEANLMCAATGLALSGYSVYVSTFALFGAGRAYEQVRNSVCYSNANVKLGLSHSGPSVGEDGGSHQSIEDIALMRVLPNMRIIVPCDAVEMEKAVFASADIQGPLYVRTGRLPLDVITDHRTPFEFGKALVMQDGTDVAIVACGMMVQEAVKAATMLAVEGISAAVINMHTIKPLDEACLLYYASRCRAMVTAEEHSIIGGLGSGVAETIAGQVPTKFERVGVMDRFGQSGKPADLFAEYGLTSQAIVKACRRQLTRA